MTFMAILFAAAAVVLFIVAFSSLFKGRVGQAIVCGLIAVVMAGIAGVVQYA